MPTDGAERVKGLLVDFGGVLTTNVWDSFRAFCDAEGLEPETVETALPRGPRGAARCCAELETGELTEEEFGRAFGAAARRRRTHDGPGRPAVRRHGAGGADDRGAARARAAPASRPGLISNSWGAGRYDRSLFDELFDGVVISGEVGLHKPQPRDLRAGRRARSASPPAECVFVDDLAATSSRPATVGMATALHPRVRGGNRCGSELEDPRRIVTGLMRVWIVGAGRIGKHREAVRLSRHEITVTFSATTGSACRRTVAADMGATAASPAAPPWPMPARRRRARMLARGGGRADSTRSTQDRRRHHEPIRARGGSDVPTTAGGANVALMPGRARRQGVQHADRRLPARCRRREADRPGGNVLRGAGRRCAGDDRGAGEGHRLRAGRARVAPGRVHGGARTAAGAARRGLLARRRAGDRGAAAARDSARPAVGRRAQAAR